MDDAEPWDVERRKPYPPCCPATESCPGPLMPECPTRTRMPMLAETQSQKNIDHI